MKKVTIRHNGRFNAFFLGKTLIEKHKQYEVHAIALEKFLKNKGGRKIFERCINVAVEKADSRATNVILDELIAKEKQKIKKEVEKIKKKKVGEKAKSE